MSKFEVVFHSGDKHEVEADRIEPGNDEVRLMGGGGVILGVVYGARSVIRKES